MVATLVHEPFHRDGWVYEEKVDGWRILAYKNNRRVRLLSRKGVDHTDRFPELAGAVGKLKPASLILDGEIAIFDKNLVSQFNLLHDADPAIVCTPPILVVFDCLWSGRRDLRSKPLRDRRAVLDEMIVGQELILPVRRLPNDGLKAWDIVRERGYEGMVAKQEASPCRSGPTRSWLKLKVRKDGRFLVGGIGERADRLPRLYVGEMATGELAYRGAVALGVGPRLVTELMKRGRHRQTPPFEGLRSRGVTWLEPEIAVEVSYGRIMQGWLREPVCRRLAE
jgi:bifunctional non-homologous end joining protein LigD